MRAAHSVKLSTLCGGALGRQGPPLPLDPFSCDPPTRGDRSGRITKNQPAQAPAQVAHKASEGARKTYDTTPRGTISNMACWCIKSPIN